jgi:hypothetical protein
MRSVRKLYAATHWLGGSIYGFYAGFLFNQGRGAEALELISQARRVPPDDDPHMFEIIGEVLLEFGHPQQAARWLTNGLVHEVGSLAELTTEDLRFDNGIARLALRRHEARRQLDLPADHIDELAAERWSLQA